MADIAGLLEDLRSEGEELDEIVAAAGKVGWNTPTPATGWDVARQIAHLAWTDEVALLATVDPDEFNRRLAELLETADEDTVASYVDDMAAAEAETPRDQLLEKWRTGRRELPVALGSVPQGQRVPWFGPPMSAASMATARLMETWAHGQDIADALGLVRAPTSRLRHVAHIGVRTRDFAFISNGLEAPTAEFHVELLAPDGQTWTWGADDAAQTLCGPALDFCLLVTQRRHPDDLDLLAEGPDVTRWLQIAQAFAGPPGRGRQSSGDRQPSGRSAGSRPGSSA